MRRSPFVHGRSAGAARPPRPATAKISVPDLRPRLRRAGPDRDPPPGRGSVPQSCILGPFRNAGCSARARWLASASMGPARMDGVHGILSPRAAGPGTMAGLAATASGRSQTIEAWGQRRTRATALDRACVASGASMRMAAIAFSRLQTVPALAPCRQPVSWTGFASYGLVETCARAGSAKGAADGSY